MEFIKDTPSEDPGFKFSDYAENLATKIVRIDHLPTVIGVFAGWGMGKTTFMRALEGALRAKDVKTVWLSAWKYNQLEEVWAALIVELAARIGDETGARDRALDMARRLVSGGVKGVLQTVAPHVPLGQTAMQIGSAAAQELKGSDIDAFQNPFEDAFQELVSKHLEGEGDGTQRLVVFLDDIDRCLPDKAITILESIKLYLDRGPLVFVVGADREVIETAIQRRYGTSVDYHGRKYLEKIVHVSFPLPHLSRKGVVELFFPKSNGDALPEATRRLLAAWSRGNPRRVIQFNNGLATTEVLIGNLPTEPMQRFTMDMITMLHLSHPQVMERFLRLRDKGLWSRFVMEFGNNNFGDQTWEASMPSLIRLHENDSNLVATMRSAVSIAKDLVSDVSVLDTSIQNAFNSAAQQLTAVSGADV